jgi:hypothetical protein
MGKDTKRHTGHTQRATEIDQSTITLKFSEDVLRAMRRLEAAVHGSKHFDSDLLQNLERLTSGEPIPVDHAVSEIALITKETMKHIHATGDKLAERAFQDFLDQIMTPIGKEPKTITLLRTPSRHR